jgi:cell wall-associated NlpC family hydrolase
MMTRQAGRRLLVVLLVLLAACAPFQRETPASSTTGAVLSQAAVGLVGAPYRYGGADPRGFDCSGLVSYVHRQAGITVPRTAAQQFAAATPVSPRDLQPGDLVFFRIDGRAVSHVGVYVGNRHFVHAPQSGGRVNVADLDDVYYRKRFAGSGRLYGDAPRQR